MEICPPRSTAQKSRDSFFTGPGRLDRGAPTKKSPSCRRKPISSTMPRQKVSMLAAEGKRSSREISTAVVFSGLITMSIFRSRRSSATLLVYS